MMFALGIIDTLTDGELNGGERVAGTGTIDAAGTVGPIGGIQQKVAAARGRDAVIATSAGVVAAVTAALLAAPADGVVVEARRWGGYGNWLRIRHANGLESGYGHLSRYGSGIRAGQRVSQGLGVLAHGVQDRTPRRLAGLAVRLLLALALSFGVSF